jgi:hypothetical protein
MYKASHFHFILSNVVLFAWMGFIQPVSAQVSLKLTCNNIFGGGTSPFSQDAALAKYSATVNFSYIIRSKDLYLQFDGVPFKRDTSLTAPFGDSGTANSVGQTKRFFTVLGSYKGSQIQLLPNGIRVIDGTFPVPPSTSTACLPAFRP